MKGVEGAGVGGRGSYASAVSTLFRSVCGQPYLNSLGIWPVWERPACAD